MSPVKRWLIETPSGHRSTCRHGASYFDAPVHDRTIAKHAFLLLSDPENPGKFANPLTYASQLDDAGHEVAVYFDGAATLWFDGYEQWAGPAVEAYERARDAGLIAGVCDHCATAMDVVDAVEREGFEIDGSAHAPDVAGLSEEGYELHMV